jgi:FtsP/CotA-like multicopper oxidase with cupredoxin domain
MKLPQSARLVVAFGLSALATVLVNCQRPAESQTGNSSQNTQHTTAAAPVCSTLSNTKTPHCNLETASDGSAMIRYDLVASRQNVKVKVENGAKPDLNLNDALVYNGSLLPERLELRRGDELRIAFRNELSMPADGRFDTLGSHDPEDNLPDMKPQFTNLHTHGLVVPWDFKDNSQGRGDNVLGILLDSRQGQPIPEGVNPADICSTTGDSVGYRYTISDDHEIGVNWYHPHPHGTSGFQVEGGMSGLLLIGDAKAEKLLNPVYLQLKDMQASKLQAENTYQFEKFTPAVATICHDKTSDDEWSFDADAPGRCDYHKQSDNQAYSWLFLVNGELFPTVNVPDNAYLRIANNSANATYRLVLEPDAVAAQTEPEKTYYTPPFRVLEKDGMTTVEKSATDEHQACTLAMTPATRVGAGLDFAAMDKDGVVCKLTVTKATDDAGRPKTDFAVERITVDEATRQALAGQAKATSFNLVQEGIDTGEDDWPSVRLARLVPDAKMPGADFDGYQLAVKQAKPAVTHTARTDVLPPENCSVTKPVADNDGVKRRHVALFYGATQFTDGEPGKEHFGLVASGEQNEGVEVTADTIGQWRKEYQRQFADPNLAQDAYNTAKHLQEYKAPHLEEAALKGLVDHKFRIEKTGFIKTNVCTETSNQVEHWRVHNLSAQIHNFHIHQMKFHVMGVRGATCQTPGTGNPQVNAFKLVDADGYLPADVDAGTLKNGMDEQCTKSYAELFYNVPASFALVERPVPAGTTGTEAAPRMMAPASIRKAVDYGMHDTFPVPPMGYIDIDVLLNKPEQVGEYVFHCHILEHEDAGMMGKLVVKPKS